MAPGKDDKKSQGSRKSSDKPGDKEKSPPNQTRSKGVILSEPRLVHTSIRQVSAQSHHHDVTQQQQRPPQQLSNIQNQTPQQIDPNQHSMNINNNMNGHCYANYIQPTENLMNMQNPALSTVNGFQVDNSAYVNQSGMLLHNNSYNSYSGQRYNIQNEVKGQNELASMIMQMNNDFSKRLTMIENSLSKLGNIENEVSLVRTEVSRIKTDNIDFNRRILEMEISCQSNSDFYDSVKKSADNNHEKIAVLEQDNRYLSHELAESKSNYNNLKEGFLELQCRTMQENLLFFGIPETEKQTPSNQSAPQSLSAPQSQSQNENETLNNRSEETSGRDDSDQHENTEDVLRNFIANDLPEHVSLMAMGIRFDRVHRLGARKRGMRNPRPIVAKFERYCDRELIRKAGMDLNSDPNSKFKVREQFPREIESRRKLLYPVMYRLKRQNPNNKVNLIRDKLYLNGRLYVPENESDYRLPPPSPERTRHSHQKEPGYQIRPPPPPQFSAPDFRTNHYLSHTRNEHYAQGAIPKQSYRGFPIQQQTPVSNRFQILAHDNERLVADRQPGQKHKFVSPLGEQTSPKKQRDRGTYTGVAPQPPLIQEISNVDSETTFTDAPNPYTEFRDSSVTPHFEYTGIRNTQRIK